MSARFSPSQLDAMGLESDGQGGWRPKEKKAIISSDDDHLSRAGQLAKEMWMKGGAIHTSLDEKGNLAQKAVSVEDLYAPIERTIPFDLEAIRALGSGTKARKESIDHLHLEAKQFLQQRKNDIFIPINTASSKNSKEIGFYYKGTGPNKQKINILMDSKLTKAYRKATAKYWTGYKDRFLEQAQGKPFPLMVQFTFIRKQLNRFDLINGCQIAADLMVEHGWMPDDSSEFFVPVFNPVVYYSATSPGLVIKVL